jgi:succinate dehydrogenase flavin-adding protein (antitoxin of CptAB toxin-antitoxin module)
MQNDKSKIKYSCRRQRGITDAGLILFGGRFLHFAMQSIASVEMTLYIRF